MLKTLTIAVIALATAAAIAPAQAGLRGISLNGPSRQGIALNGSSLRGTSLNGPSLTGAVAPDASGMRVIAIRLPGGATHSSK